MLNITDSLGGINSVIYCAAQQKSIAKDQSRLQVPWYSQLLEQDGGIREK